FDIRGLRTRPAQNTAASNQRGQSSGHGLSLTLAKLILNHLFRQRQERPMFFQQSESEGKDTAMNYSIYLALIMATAGRHAPEDVVADTQKLSDVPQSAMERIHILVERLRRGSLSPLATAEFEKDLQHATRELGRVVAQWTYNHLEPADKQVLPD